MNIIELDLFEKSDKSIKESFIRFLKSPSHYKNEFLQSRYNTAFDGYSYLGQKDSLNQYDTDMLHSFVLSDFQHIEYFPKEFHGFLSKEWPELTARVRERELKITKELDIPISELYENDSMGYMMSCNYYPKPNTCKLREKNNTRLSAHTDVSLFTIFPYGVPRGLSYFDGNKHLEIGKKEKAIMFFGYFLEFVTDCKIKALNHQVELPNDLDSERFSFAIFSIPKPDSIFRIGNRKFSANDYYTQYLSLF